MNWDKKLGKNRICQQFDCNKILKPNQKTACCVAHSRFKNINGQRFGWLTAITPIGKNEHNLTIWILQCDCGGLIKTTITQIMKGHTQSCGCYHRKQTIEVNIKRTGELSSGFKHGLSKTRLYSIWHSIRSNKKRSKMCKEWDDFSVFYNWAMSNGYKENLVLGRNGDEGIYEPTNCQWKTVKENSAEAIFNIRKKSFQLGWISCLVWQNIQRKSNK